MESTSFKNILDKFKQGANSMDEVYSDLSYLTANYDQEIEKLQREVEDEKIRANNEEFVRHEAERDLDDLRKLQEINFAVIVEGLIKKPKEEFETQISKTMKKFTFTLIILTIISITAILYSFQYFSKNNFDNKNYDKAFEQINKSLMELKKENSKLKELLNKKPIIMETKAEDKVPEKKKDEVILMNPVKEENATKTETPEEMEKKVNPQNEDLSLQNKEEFLEKVLAVINEYDKKFKLSGKHSTRILYKMFLLDLAPFKHETIIEELSLYAKANTYIPKKEDLLIWDKQMLFIYTKMSETVKDIPNSKITTQMKSFNRYKFDDATNYSGWEYIGQNDEDFKGSIEKEIAKLTSQMIMNNK